jgi:hypothetical protein
MNAKGQKSEFYSNGVLQNAPIKQISYKGEALIAIVFAIFASSALQIKYDTLEGNFLENLETSEVAYFGPWHYVLETILFVSEKPLVLVLKQGQYSA